ncbi:uncharacterized protein L3040_008678 [Drepanopeziza brunnea f. sp. 'multigermtubi']|uniref:uncharacterized protein n=1 Tax=Drepanopeziza brunnea f. sp. 'multigermtubi' TaxID=698441 RepID=UPI0023851A90|nr:hypothetical protein L3040_008678 [Drepanopeziza brunnea f. sp. 'multigermtubi']
MKTWGNLPASQEDFPACIPRTSSTSDFSTLIRKDIDERSSRRRAATNESENSQVLYMANPKRSRRSGRKSLSSVANNLSRGYEGSSDKEEAHVRDTLSWNIIDQEIYEWQYVCQTGRPYWWSQESKYTRLKKLQPRVRDSSTGCWMRELDASPKPVFAEKRRAVSDNYFCDPSTIHDLAHLIAVQLLGACFTLPPDHILGIPSPSYTFDRYAAGRLPDPRMISSLRMHTQFRYSPSFGHQARNTSPVQAWPRRFGASSPGFSTSVAGTGDSTGASRRASRRRTVNTTNGSASSGSLDSNGKDILDGASRTETSRPTTSGHPAYSSNRTSNGRQQRSSQGEWKITYPDSTSNSRPGSKYSLEAAIRSEPHHVFIQPVRELVVKRWAKFKRRLSGSLHSALPMRGSEDQGSELGSTVSSSDARTRRRRAQERGEIHSSIDSTPPAHYNSPASGNASPSGSPMRVDWSRAPVFPLSNANISEGALAAADRRIAAAALSRSSSPSPRIRYTYPSESPVHSPQEMSGLAPLSRPAFPLYPPVRFSSSGSVAAPKSKPKSFSSARNSARQQRKSRLSEMHTLDDVHAEHPELDDRHALSAPASTLNSTVVSPMELPGRLLEDLSAASSPDPVAWRPRMERLSSNGTQIFTPQDDGIELDGLPVGPASNVWTRGVGRESSYL